MGRYSNNNIITGLQGDQYYSKTFYPIVPPNDTDFFVVTQEEDRYDLLANQYYRDSSLWWVIASANPDIGFNNIYLPPGKQIRIPVELSDILNEYDVVNQ